VLQILEIHQLGLEEDGLDKSFKRYIFQIIRPQEVSTHGQAPIILCDSKYRLKLQILCSEKRRLVQHSREEGPGQVRSQIVSD
jgi:hypothetical protein